MNETGSAALMRAVWRYKGIPAASLLLMLVLAAVYLCFAPAQYEATAVIYPPADITIRPAATFGTSLGLLDAGKTPPTPFEKYLAVLRTPEFAIEMDRRLGLAKRLFAAEWDEAAGQWRSPTGMSAWIAGMRGSPPAHFDPIRALTDFFDAHLILNQADKRVSLTTITFASRDRQLAHDVLSNGLDTARQMLIAREETRLRQEIDYLETQIQAVQLVEHRTELSRLLAEQERQMMLLKAGSYGADMLQPVYTPPEPTQPSVRVTLLLAAAIGLAFGISGALFMALRRT